MQIVHLVGAKGGVGTSSVVALCAAALAAEGRRVGVADATRTGDVASILDDATKACQRVIQVLSGLDDLTDGVTANEREDRGSVGDQFDTLLVDHLALPSVLPLSSGSKILVVTNCFLAVNRALHAPFTPDGVIVMRHRHRSIRTVDLEAVLSIPAGSALEILVDSAIARWIDAGLVASIPGSVLRALRLAEFIDRVARTGGQS